MNATLLAELLAVQDILVLERQSEGVFRVYGKEPAWLGHLFGSPPQNSAILEPAVRFPFLETFLPTAEEMWRQDSAQSLRSGLWTERAPDGQEFQLEASACTLSQEKFLLIRRLMTDYEERLKILQAARETALDYERLNKEINQKEILLHCIIHDLSGPLAGMQGCFEVLGEENLSPQGKQFLQLGQLESNKQSNLIHDLLDVFSAEVNSLEKFTLDPMQAPDLVGCARQVLDGLSPVFALKGVHAELRLPTDPIPSWKVAAEPSKLERIFYNLLQNGLRHTPKGGSVTIVPRAEEPSIYVAIEDNGPGVPAEIAPELFQKFVRSKSKGGKAGLGLFFCRIMVEQWGGSIGHEPRPGGGSRFWFRLKRVG